MTMAAPEFTVVTYNIHKGLSQFNRRMVIHEIRERPARARADVVFLQEVQGRHERHALRFAAWPALGNTSSSPEERWQHVYG